MAETDACKEILKLKPEELHLLAAELASYALKRWLPHKYDIYLEKGQSLGSCRVEDFAYEAIQRALSTRKKWNKQKYHTLKDFLYSIVRSIINQYLNSSGYKQMILEDGLDLTENDDETVSETYVERQPSQDESPSDIAARQEQRELLGIEFFCSLNDDGKAQEILSCLLADKKPIEISEELNLSVAEVHAGKKRILRKLELFWQEKSEENKPLKEKVVKK